MLLVSFMVNVTGTLLLGISKFMAERVEIWTIYTALIGMIGNVGSVIGSTATTKLALGLLAPSFSSMRNHAKTIFSAWSASIIMFVILAVISLSIHRLFSFSSFSTRNSIRSPCDTSASWRMRFSCFSGCPSVGRGGGRRGIKSPPRAIPETAETWSTWRSPRNSRSQRSLR